MWLVPEEDKKAFLEFFGKSKMSWVQANPFVMRIAQWKKVPEKDKNSKDKEERKILFKISQEERQKLLNYLKNRPYQEVFTLIALVVGLKPVENSKAKEEKKN